MKFYRLGCSGWSYTDWVGKFYPDGCPQNAMLEEYAKHFDTVEINMSFYRLPFENMVKSWERRTPEGFLFAPKISRTITHVKRLKRSHELVSAFVARMGHLTSKLGPILVQLPPGLKPDIALLEGFVSALPEGHRWAIEFRNEQWLCEGVQRVLERYGIATCLVDSPKMVVNDKVTAGFAYVRWHGRSSWYSHDYARAEIREWAQALERLPVDQVFGYWNNDVNANAPKNCLSMLKLLGR